MSLKAKTRLKSAIAIITSIMLYSTCTDAKELKDTGTVDTLISQGLKQYQQQMSGQSNAKKSTAKDSDIIPQYPHRPQFIGYFSDGTQSKAQIYYKGGVRYYRVGDKIPRNYKLLNINPQQVKVKMPSGRTKIMSMRSVRSLHQEEIEFYQRHAVKQHQKKNKRSRR